MSQDRVVPDSSDARGNVSRRGFLKGAGLGAAGAAIVETGLSAMTEAASAASGPAVAGPGRVAVALSVNGAERKLDIEPRTTLAEALRDDLGLTGTKVVCDRGSCSACTVLLDGTAVVSCMTLAIDVDGRKVTTIEGLAKGDVLHPVQEAFIAHDAMQCGFCTPGMVMSSVDLLKRNRQPSEHEVRDWLEGNLCRCTGYHNIVKSVLACAAETKGSAT